MPSFGSLWAAWKQIEATARELERLKAENARIGQRVGLDAHALADCNSKREDIERLYQESQRALQAQALPTPPTMTVIEPGFRLRETLLTRWPKAWLYLLDVSYPVTTEEEVLRFLAETRVAREQYVEEYHDCDDFAWHLRNDMIHWRAACLFVTGAWGVQPHAWNAVPCYREAELVWLQVEPQSAQVVEQGYAPTYILG